MSCRFAARWCRVLVVVGAAGALGGLVSVVRAAPPADTQVLHRQSFPDKFAETDAFTILVPDGWKMDGHVTWNLASVRIVDVDAMVTDPATGAGLFINPRLLYSEPQKVGQNEGKEFILGSPVHHQPASPADYVRNFSLPQFRKGVAAAKDLKFSAETDLPELAKVATDSTKKFWDAQHKEATIESRASRFRITYTGPDGRAYEEQFTCILTSTQLPSSNGAPSTTWAAVVRSCRAPAGQLDAMLPLFATVESSFTQPFAWDNFRFNCTMMAWQGAIDAKNRDTEIMRKAAIEKSKIADESRHKQYAADQAAKAQMQHEEMNYIKDKKDFVNPADGTTLTLSAAYSHNWLSSKGDVYSTQNPTYDPRGSSPDVTWYQLEAK